MSFRGLRPLTRCLALALTVGLGACYVPKDLCVPGFEPGEYEVLVIEKYDAASSFQFDPALVGSSPPEGAACGDRDGVVAGARLLVRVENRTRNYQYCKYFEASLVDSRVVRKSELTIAHRPDKAMFVVRDVLQTSPGCDQDFVASVFSPSGVPVLGAPTPGTVPGALMGRTLGGAQCGGCTEYWVVQLTRSSPG